MAVMKIVLICLISVAVVSATATLHNNVGRVKRAVDAAAGAVGFRSKRQAEGVSGALCFSRCLRSFKDYLEERSGGELDLKQLQQGFFDKTDLFDDATFLPEFCAEYNVTTACVNTCGEFGGRGQAEKQLASLDFMCVEHYDEFIAYQPCYRNLSSSGADEKCVSTCGGEDYVVTQIGKLENFGDEPDFSALMEIMGNLCGFIQCHLDCQRPLYKTVCGSAAPGVLIDDFIATTIGGAMSQLNELGLSALVPDQCNALAGDDEAKAKLQKERVELSTDAKHSVAACNDVSAMQLTVLEKESRKLDLEIKKIELEMELINRKLTN